MFPVPVALSAIFLKKKKKRKILVRRRHCVLAGTGLFARERLCHPFHRSDLCDFFFLFFIELGMMGRGGHSLVSAYRRFPRPSMPSMSLLGP